MRGKVTTFLKQKGYGFLEGEDGESYFMHKSDLASPDMMNELVEGDLVDFEPSSTPKGYRAQKCRLLNKPSVGYVGPDRVQVSDIGDPSRAFKDWEVIEVSDYLVRGTIRGGAKEARQKIDNLASLYGANAVLNFNAWQETGSEPGSGRGTHYYTYLAFDGRLANIAKKMAGEPHSKAHFQNLNKVIQEKYWGYMNRQWLTALLSISLVIYGLYALANFTPPYKYYLGYGPLVVAFGVYYFAYNNRTQFLNKIKKGFLSKLFS